MKPSRIALVLAACLGGVLASTRADAAQFGDIAFVGDSFVYRSQWQCDGLGLTAAGCNALKLDSSFTRYVADPYGWGTAPLFTVTAVDGRGGSTCLGRPQLADPGVMPRLGELQVASGTRVALMIGINDLNAQMRSEADARALASDVAACHGAAWAEIASRGGVPMSMLYPPIDPGTTVWGGGADGAQAVRNAHLLNAALRAEAWRYNDAVALQGGTRVQLVDLSNAYGPGIATGNTTDGVHPTPNGAITLARFFYWAFH